MKKAAMILAAAGIAAFGVAACGSSSSSSDTTSATSSGSSSTSSGGTSTAASSGQTLSFDTASGTTLAFTNTAVTAKPGETTFQLDNKAVIPHDLVVQDSSGNEVGRAPITNGGSTGTFDADLKPGTYTFFCDLPGHMQTMHGTITVK